MPYIPSNIQDNIAYLNGENNGQVKTLSETSAAPESVATPASGSLTTAPTSPVGTESPIKAQTPATSYTPGISGPMTTRLFNPLQQGLQEGNTQLQQLQQTFQAAAGPSRTYQTSGVQSELSRAIQPGATQTAKDRAKAILGTTYQGPQGLDSDDLAKLTEALGRLYGASKDLGTGKGLSTYVKQALPGSTLGEQKTEATTLLQSPAYSSQRAAIEAQAKGIVEAQTTATEQATAYAQQRAQEEAAIASEAREYLTGQKEAINADLQAKIDAANAQQASLQAQFNAYLQGGALPTGITDYDKILQSPGHQGAAQAEAAWNEIMARYPNIAQIPLMIPGNTPGLFKERLELPAEWMTANTALVNSPEWNNLREQVIERQRALEQLFSPLAGQGTKYGPAAGMSNEGALSMYRPLYGSDTNPLDTEVAAWQPATDLRSYVTFDPGLSPSRNQVSTEEQRAQYNAIEELIGEADQLSKSDEPLRAAQILVDVQRYLNDEKANLEQWDKLPTESLKNWKKKVDKLNSKAKDASSLINSFINTWPGQMLGGSAALAGTVLEGVGAPVSGQMLGGLASTIGAILAENAEKGKASEAKPLMEPLKLP